jgi:hypothetical protein
VVPGDGEEVWEKYIWTRGEIHMDKGRVGEDIGSKKTDSELHRYTCERYG